MNPEMKQMRMMTVLREFRMIPRMFMLCAMAVSALLGPSQAAAAEVIQWSEQVQIPSIALRGYGQVSGASWSSDDGSTSLLRIVCEDEAHAKLLQAKYLSDIGLAPKVSSEERPWGEATLQYLKVDGQGAVCAVQTENVVYIAAVDDVAELGNVLAAAGLSAGNTVAEVEVPMWLDRWDRFGFRHYYRPWELPADQGLKEYDFVKEFDFAEENDRNGFIFWTNPSELDTAEGLTNERWWNWALHEADSRDLPVGLNIMTGGVTSGVGRSWFYNRYRDEASPKMPQFTGNPHMIANPFFSGPGNVSLSSGVGRDMELAFLQDIVERLVGEHSNVVSVLEPHGELRHGAHDLFLEYGPVADASFSQLMQDRYTDLASINEAWGRQYQAWDEVRVPEVASFTGWSDDAIDLRGEWRVGYEETVEPQPLYNARMMGGKYSMIPSKGTPAKWFAKDYDDSDWPVVTAPGNDRTSFLAHRPAVYRRSFDVPAEWLKQHSKVWLYVWDMNTATKDQMTVALNGETLLTERLEHTIPHWCAVDVSALLQSEQNQLSIRLPKGFLAYRVYLSPEAPRQYPNLGLAGNARWVDFMDWMRSTRTQAVRRGMEIIRQVEPNRQIVMMAPDGYEDGVIQLAIDYGGNFHNTGHMGAFWGDLLPSLMRGAQLPFSLEPGGPAGSVKDFKKHLGRYSTEGLQGIDYYIHIGSLMWKPEMKAYFEKVMPLVKLIGKYHAPTAEIAALYSTNNEGYTGYPWGTDYNTNLEAGYWNWNVRTNLMGDYESDGLTESSFTRSDAARYKIIFDTNSSILDATLLDNIENYVRDGGVFVTYAQTGRHSPMDMDSWPIERLTGFHVSAIDALDASGKPMRQQGLQPVQGQDIFSGDWKDVRANGLTLEPVANDAIPLMLWEDGSVAIGMRPIGAGYIVQIGCKFTGKGIPDRILPGGLANPPIHSADNSESGALSRLLRQILNWREIETVSAQFMPRSSPVILRHFIANNGLYNVWSLWNRSESETVQGEVDLSASVAASWAWDPLAKDSFVFGENVLPVTLEPLQTRAFLSPTNKISAAPLTWFNLQRQWWRQGKTPPASDLPEIPHQHSIDLNADWAFMPLAYDQDGAALAAVDVDDREWERIDMGIWSLPDRRDVKRALLRKQFTLPADWNHEIRLSIQSWLGQTFVDEGRIWLDGQLIRDWSPDGISNLNTDGVLQAGKTHTLAVEIRSVGSLSGARGNAWLWHWPAPESTLDLSGEWMGSQNALYTVTKAVTFPGNYSDMVFKREVLIPEDQAGRAVTIKLDATGGMTGALINGVWVRRLHHHIGTEFDLNITPWIKFGESNTIELVCMNGPAKGTIRSVVLNFYSPEQYP